MKREILFSKENLIKLFVELESKLGKQPTKYDWTESSSTPSLMPVRQRFGNWTNLLKEVDKSPLKVLPYQTGASRKGVRNKSRVRMKLSRGYIQVFEPDHPAAKKDGYVLEHRMIAYDHGLLKNLSDDVHHINGIKDDNRIENLQVLSRSDHAKISTPKGSRRPRRDSKPCHYNNCSELTSSVYGLCRRHYKREWQLGNKQPFDLIGNIHATNEREAN